MANKKPRTVKYTFEVYQSHVNNQYYSRIISINGNNIFNSGEGYLRKRSAKQVFLNLVKAIKEDKIKIAETSA